MNTFVVSFSEFVLKMFQQHFYANRNMYFCTNKECYWDTLMVQTFNYFWNNSRICFFNDVWILIRLFWANHSFKQKFGFVWTKTYICRHRFNHDYHLIYISEPLLPFPFYLCFINHDQLFKHVCSLLLHLLINDCLQMEIPQVPHFSSFFWTSTSIAWFHLKSPYSKRMLKYVNQSFKMPLCC